MSSAPARTAEVSYSRYLASKRSVDDRALNGHVLDRLRGELSKSMAEPLRIIEVGGGLGTMVARLLELQMVVQAEYLLLDVDAQLLAEARAWLATWAATRKLAAVDESDTLRIRGESGVDVAVRFVQSELGAFLARENRPAPADLLIANAFLDLVDLCAILPDLFALLLPGGLYLFTLNFDGETVLQPEHPDDGFFLRVYHRSMDERVRYGRRAGDSHCGRHLFGHLRAAGASILAAGASDWVVFPESGRYPEDEATFLHCIIDTIGAELRQHAEVPVERLDPWLVLRRQQIDRGELVYLAHQLDFIGRRPGVRPT